MTQEQLSGAPVVREAAQNGRPRPRVRVRGKFLFVGDRKLHVRGVTYGPFGPSTEAGEARFDERTVESDFAAMAERGINAVRVYELPPAWMLDAAERHGIYVMVGIPWEQHIAFLRSRSRRRDIECRVRDAVASCAGHPAVLCYVIGNEIPASIVRWHGRRRIERFIHRLYRVAKEADPDGLVTYVNYPSTEYLRLSFVDVVCFNVYLEEKERLEAYVARLQNIADDRPLLMAEVGLDSRRNTEEQQADTLAWQIRSCFALGCAGLFVFAWTDEWHRGGHDIEDWDFGLTTRDRDPKPALDAVAAGFAEMPYRPRGACPRISVVICTYNGARTLRDCLEGVTAIQYPNFEVVLVSDGSTDGSADIAREFGVRVIETPNQGLSAARNEGLAAADGEIIAYLDDDARPDPEWLDHLAHAFTTGDWAGVGGPNVLPPGSGDIEQCVANAPGGPTHVLLSDREAEHLPGCNIAFRRSALEAVGGFDSRFHAAGDDVDICWRLIEQGERLGFAPGAVVWHHRRNSVRAYVAQQLGYGRAEALLESKWPERYSPGGHVKWGGRLYGNGSAQHRGGWRWRIYYGGWGTALFQSIYGPPRGLLESLPLMPEWYLAILVLAAFSAGGLLWAPLLLALPFLAAAVGALVFDAALGAARAPFSDAPRGRRLVRLRALTAGLYLLQPLARLYGRLVQGLTPIRRRGPIALALPRPRDVALWSERWHAGDDWVRIISDLLRGRGGVITPGGDWDRWDLQVRASTQGGVRLLTGVEEHGGGKQLVRVRWWPHVARFGVVLVCLPAAISLAALLAGAPRASLVFATVAALIAARLAYECAAAAGLVARALERDAPAEEDISIAR